MREKRVRRGFPAGAFAKKPFPYMIEIGSALLRRKIEDQYKYSETARIAPTCYTKIPASDRGAARRAASQWLSALKKSRLHATYSSASELFPFVSGELCPARSARFFLKRFAFRRAAPKFTKSVSFYRILFDGFAGILFMNFGLFFT
jgi:hypothetical protein